MNANELHETVIDNLYWSRAHLPHAGFELTTLVLTD